MAAKSSTKKSNFKVNLYVDTSRGPDNNSSPSPTSASDIVVKNNKHISSPYSFFNKPKNLTDSPMSQVASPRTPRSTRSFKQTPVVAVSPDLSTEQRLEKFREAADKFASGNVNADIKQMIIDNKQKNADKLALDGANRTEHHKLDRDDSALATDIDMFAVFNNACHNAESMNAMQFCAVYRQVTGQRNLFKEMQAFKR